MLIGSHDRCWDLAAVPRVFAQRLLTSGPGIRGVPDISTASATPFGAIPRSTTSAPHRSKDRRSVRAKPLHFIGASPKGKPGRRAASQIAQAPTASFFCRFTKRVHISGRHQPNFVYYLQRADQRQTTMPAAIHPTSEAGSAASLRSTKVITENYGIADGAKRCHSLASSLNERAQFL